MNEFLVLFDTARGIAWVAFGATFLLAAGLAIFDRRSTLPASREDVAEPVRKAA